MQPISVLEAGNATLAQLVEQRIRNAQVEGSNPLSGSLAALDLWIPGGFCLWVFFWGAADLGMIISFCTCCGTPVMVVLGIRILPGMASG